jgi:transcription antitermination factor NusG
LNLERESCSRLGWYAIRSVPRHEKRVRDRLQAQAIECFLPTTKSVHRWKNGIRREVEAALFPTYVFVRGASDSRFAILSTQGVRCFVGVGASPSRIPDQEIEALRGGLRSVHCEAHPILFEGKKVRIIGGPFKGLDGIVLRNSRTFRVLVTISVVMQGVSVELDRNDIEIVRDRVPLCGYAELSRTA